MKKLTGKINKDMRIILKEIMKNDLTIEEYVEIRKKESIKRKDLEHLRQVFINLDEEGYISTGVKDEKAFIAMMIYDNWGLSYDTFVTDKGRKFIDWKTNLPLIMSSIAAFSSFILLIVETIKFLIDILS